MKVMISALALLLSGSTFAATNLDSPPAFQVPTCTVAVNPAGYPQYAGTYQFYISGLFANAATLNFTPYYPQHAGTYSKSYNLGCYTMHGMPSIASCSETGNDVYKYTVSYTGSATLGVSGPGININLGAMNCQ